MTFVPGQTVYITRATVLRAHADFGDVIELEGAQVVSQIEGDALVVAAKRGVVRAPQPKQFRKPETKRDRSAWALMLLLPDGQYGWLVGDSSFPKVTTEPE